jgi:anti-anti-sigma factor
MMQSTLERQSHAMVIELAGRLDAMTAPDLERRCDQCLLQGNTGLVIDCAELEYLSSAGLRSILSVVKKVKAVRGRLAVCCLRSMVDEVFTVSGFSTYIPVFASREEAIDAVA